MKALILYDSIGGNTKKVAEKIYAVLKKMRLEVNLIKVESNLEINFNDYDLIFCGSPVIEWLPTPTMMDYLKAKLKESRITRDIIPCAPIKSGKYAVCFGTYCGAHIGVDEATPMTHWLAAFFGHIGFQVMDKIYLPGEMRRPISGNIILKVGDDILQENNLEGIFGNIIGRPNEADLQEVAIRITGLVKHLHCSR